MDAQPLAKEVKRKNEEYKFYDRLYTECLKIQYVSNVVLTTFNEIHKKYGSNGKKETPSPFATWAELFPLIASAFKFIMDELEMEAKESEKNGTDFRFGRVLSQKRDMLKVINTLSPAKVSMMRNEILNMTNDANYGTEIRNLENELKEKLVGNRNQGSTVRRNDIIKLNSIPEGLSRILEVTLKLSLAELIKLTPEDHIDYNDLIQADKTINKLLEEKDKLFQNLNGAKLTIQFANVQNYFSSNCPSRSYYGKGLIEGLHGTQDKKQYIVYVFSDCIAFSKCRTSTLKQFFGTLNSKKKIEITALFKFENIQSIKYDNDAISIREECGFFTICRCLEDKNVLHEFHDMDPLYDVISIANEKYSAKDNKRKPVTPSYGSAINHNHHSSQANLNQLTASEARSSLTRSSSVNDALCDVFGCE